MSHDRDHDHPEPLPPREPEPLVSKQKPDRTRCDHPTVVPREPVDPKTHPNRRLVLNAARARAAHSARPA
jgi:hypothetical protein